MDWTRMCVRVCCAYSEATDAFRDVQAFHRDEKNGADSIVSLLSAKRASICREAKVAL